MRPKSIQNSIMQKHPETLIDLLVSFVCFLSFLQTSIDLFANACDFICLYFLWVHNYYCISDVQQSDGRQVEQSPLFTWMVECLIPNFKQALFMLEMASSSVEVQWTESAIWPWLMHQMWRSLKTTNRFKKYTTRKGEHAAKMSRGDGMSLGIVQDR